MDTSVDLTFYTDEPDEIAIISGQMGSEVTFFESLDQICPFLGGTGQLQSIVSADYFGAAAVEVLLKASKELEIDESHEAYASQMLNDYHRSQVSSKQEL